MTFLPQKFDESRRASTKAAKKTGFVEAPQQKSGENVVSEARVYIVETTAKQATVGA